MKIVIAGSREIVDYGILCLAIFLSDFSITEVVSGGARGPDSLGERWATENDVSISRAIPDWDRFGKAAGMC